MYEIRIQEMERLEDVFHTQGLPDKHVEVERIHMVFESEEEMSGDSILRAATSIYESMKDYGFSCPEDVDITAEFFLSDHHSVSMFIA